MEKHIKKKSKFLIGFMIYFAVYIFIAPSFVQWLAAMVLTTVALYLLMDKFQSKWLSLFALNATIILVNIILGSPLSWTHVIIGIGISIVLIYFQESGGNS